MTSKQRRQLQEVENVLGGMTAELSPRVIEPSPEKQIELGIADETMLIPIGTRRAVTVSALQNGGWAIKEFETTGGELKPLRQLETEPDDDLVIVAALSTVVRSMRQLLEPTGDDALPEDERVSLANCLALLNARHDKLVAEGISGFEFEAIDAD